ncbi:NAD-dependent succinate-semialdehyde dehydrogenase [Spelaeicoccus albus]|uniref:Succinate-semialdehyde dehydrogenase/glutarate-semialdehyde dehydrogenase n=1 Tax=Spelaeicoccus albus TaxID=1280376 RepID=A0A7Z0D1S6_9MICO|nr:NAD-dependent succinate-semialdehyde dehydrogenase [Spelaeicoccus albus]NYI66792.1 succinate-semialdehyde dehydrogenase/glutarate-semialdehyde dehydrogenase [Spelaeicoccus albus]
MTTYKSVNPATGETLEEFPETTSADIEAALAKSDKAYHTWKTTSLDERAAVLNRVAEIFQERKDDLARLIGSEMGKPFAQAKGEVDIVSSIFRYYAENGASFMADEKLSVAGGGSAVVRKAPVGSLLGIMPWNYPYYQVARFAAPNLMLGNTVLLKHAPNCPQSALAIEQIFADAGLLDGAYINIFATNDQVADILADQRNQGVSLTGSERAGSAVAETAGRNLKKCVLELGGSDAFILLDTADLTKTAKMAAAGRLGNAGQACNSPKRFIVKDDLYDDFVSELTARISKVTPGDPADPSTTFGPLSSQAAADNLMAQIKDAIDKGATVHAGGKAVDGPGAYVEPTVLTDITPEMRAYQEELFGPAAVVYKVSTEDEAVDLANSSPYGLGGAVWSEDTDKARAVADRLDTGMVWINGLAGTQADLPFGGVKRSGIGRELGKYGMDEFVNKKLIREEA